MRINKLFCFRRDKNIPFIIQKYCRDFFFFCKFKPFFFSHEHQYFGAAVSVFSVFLNHRDCANSK